MSSCLSFTWWLPYSREQRRIHDDPVRPAEEEFVVYRALYGKQDLWIRPAAMFAEMVSDKERYVPRFEFIEDAERPSAR